MFMFMGIQEVMERMLSLIIEVIHMKILITIGQLKEILIPIQVKKEQRRHQIIIVFGNTLSLQKSDVFIFLFSLFFYDWESGGCWAFVVLQGFLSGNKKTVLGQLGG